MSQLNDAKSIGVYADDDTDDIELVRDAFDQYATNVKLISFSNGVEAHAFFDRLTQLDQGPLPD
jgi:hypothetical protein